MSEATLYDYHAAVKSRDEAIRERDEARAECEQWRRSFAGHLYVPTADYAEMVKARDERDALRAKLDEARAELARWATWGTIEVAIRNPNVASYIEHWEKRALSAEAERDAPRGDGKEGT